MEVADNFYKCVPKSETHGTKKCQLHYPDANLQLEFSMMKKSQILKNLFTVCLAILLLYSTNKSLSNLQSTMNFEGNVGVISESIINVTMILSSLFLPKLVIKKLGCKFTMFLAIIGFAPYTVANIYPSMGALVPSAILRGLGAAPLWASKGTYFNQLSVLHAKHGEESADLITAHYFGIFFMMYQTTHIWGNLVSFYVLKPSYDEHHHYSDTTLGTLRLPANQSLTCGVGFCGNLDENFEQVTEYKRYVLVSIYTACVILAALLIVIFLDPLEASNNGIIVDGKASSNAIATLKHLQKPNQLLLVPLTIFTGIQSAFILGDYSKAYVACSWGLHNIGLVFIFLGVVSASLSLTASRVVKYVPRVVLIICGAIGNMVACAILFFWQPNEEEKLYFFGIIGIWAFSDAIWQTQVNALYGSLFRSEEEAAFANYVLCVSLGCSLSFGYSSFLCMSSKIYILLSFLIVGMAGYIAVELRVWLNKGNYEVTNRKQNVPSIS